MHKVAILFFFSCDTWGGRDGKLMLTCLLRKAVFRNNYRFQDVWMCLCLAHSQRKLYSMSVCLRMSQI